MTGTMCVFADLYFFTCVKYINHLCQILVTKEEVLGVKINLGHTH